MFSIWLSDVGAYGVAGYKFDDDKVSVVSHDKIVALDGGGEDSVAYILLYRSVSPFFSARRPRD